MFAKDFVEETDFDPKINFETETDQGHRIIVGTEKDFLS